MTNIKLQRRRQNALDRLVKQYESNVKNTKTGYVSLSDGDRIRIQNEIETLKNRT